MKVRVFIFSVLFVFGFLSITIYSSANTADITEPTIQEPIRGKDTPELIQRLISEMKAQVEKKTDILPELIKEVSDYTNKCADPTGVAVLHSMLAEMYANYYQQNQYAIYNRIHISGYEPTDIRLWPSNLFTQKIEQELNASLTPASLLQETPVSVYKTLFEAGENSSELRPTLFDFLASRAIEIQPSAQWYTTLIKFRKTQNNPFALLMNQLDYLHYQYYGKQSLTMKEYNQILDSLASVYSKNDYAAEISIAKLQLLIRQQLQGDQTQQPILADSIYALCNQSIHKYPNYKRINFFKNQLMQMEAPILNAQAVQNVYPGKVLRIQLNYVNTPKVFLRIYALKEQGKRVLIQELPLTLRISNSYTEMDTLLSVRMDQTGLFLYELSTTTQPAVTISDRFSVSRLGALVKNSNKKNEVLITDFESGKPLRDIRVEYGNYSEKTNRFVSVGSIKTDAMGMAEIPQNKEILAIRPVTEKDSSVMPTWIYPSDRSYTDPQTAPVQLSLFTDRCIYRPGDMVCFKGIAYTDNPDDPKTIAGKTYMIQLYDANQKQVGSKTVKTDAYGSFNGDFMLPANVLTGNFRLVTENEVVFINVESYKRPTFKVELNEVTQQTPFNKPVLISGKAKTYSGVNLQEGTIRWEVSRRPFRFGQIRSLQAQTVASGLAELSSKGEFSFDFTPTREGMHHNYHFEPYEVRVILTSASGETEESKCFFYAGDQGLFLSIQMPEDPAERNEVNASIEGYSINRKPLHIDGTFSIYRLREEVKPDISGSSVTYIQENKVATGKLRTGSMIESAVFSKLLPGRYRIIAESADSAWKAFPATKDFVLYDKKDKRPPVFSHTWLIKERTECAPGENALFVFGTSDQHTYILYELQDERQNSLEKKFIRLNNENKTFSIPFPESYGRGFTANFTFVKEGKVYREEVLIERKYADRELKIYTETFRDKILPGGKENWKFQILNTDSVPVHAEVLAGMYDASLDHLIPFKWSFHPVRAFYLSPAVYDGGSSFSSSFQYETGATKELKVAEYQYNRLDWQGVLTTQGDHCRAMPGAIALNKRSACNPLMEDNVSSLASEKGNRYTVYDAETGPELPISPTDMRDDFAETAFFYPALMSDSTGQVSLQFTMPESNTSWKLQLLAQTKDLHYGYLSKEIITQKPLMITPNLPRFLRKGDICTISAMISNQSDEICEGEASFELLNPVDGKTIVCPAKPQKSFALEAGKQTTVSWSFTVPEQIEGVVGCRFTAATEKSGDGEQVLLPVLSDQMLITESTPFYLSDKKTETVVLKEQRDTKPYRFTFELTVNPIWYAVQALPILTQPGNGNAIDWFGVYFSNALASHIAQSNPKIKQYADQWKKEDGDASSFYSNLQKNETLKNCLLQETPWLLEAETESEQKQRLSQLFNSNRTSEQLMTSLSQLSDLQTKEGGWCWFKGMQPSMDITLYILNGMSKLTTMNAVALGEQERLMIIHALRFADLQLAEEFNKKRKESLLTPAIVHYLHVRSAFRDIEEDESAREAIRFYTNLAQEQWKSQSIHIKAEIAFLLSRNGEMQTVHEILEWFKKTATTSAQGMYWANNHSNPDFMTTSIDVHCLIMSLFEKLSPNQQDNDLMKLWLLNQKRTQSWSTTPSTMSAICALLLTGSNWLDENNACSIECNNEIYTTASGTASTGYLRKAFPTTEAKTEATRTAVIRKTGTAPVWGAIYKQYFQPMKQVSAQGDNLQIEKKLFLENMNEKERQLIPVSVDNPLEAGTKVIVQLVVKNKQTMDYVCIKDLYAGCLEITDPLSGTYCQEGLLYYKSSTDVAVNFFFDELPKGTYVLEYGFYVTRKGNYTDGVTSIQCLYAPEYVAHSSGKKILVN